MNIDLKKQFRKNLNDLNSKLNLHDQLDLLKMNLEFRNFNERPEEQLADWQQNEKEEFIRFCKFVSEKTQLKSIKLK